LVDIIQLWIDHKRANPLPPRFANAISWWHENLSNYSYMSDIQDHKTIVSLRVATRMPGWGLVEGRNDIRVYRERPAVPARDDKRLSPNNLFSLFTAEIIEKNVVFIR
jgi:hypothetical protein